jgi:hypothetical protein
MRLSTSTTRSIKISELHVGDSIWGEQGLEFGWYNLGKLDPETITDAAPTLRQLKTLTLPLGNYGNREDNSEIGDRAAQILSTLPSLEHLTVQSCHNCQVSTENILQSIFTKSLRSISLYSCVYRASSFTNFLNKHSGTLKEIFFLEDTRLLGSRLEELFRSMRENISLGNLGLEGRPCEFKDDLKLEPYKDSEELELTLVPWEFWYSSKT